MPEEGRFLPHAYKTEEVKNVSHDEPLETRPYFSLHRVEPFRLSVGDGSVGPINGPRPSPHRGHEDLRHLWIPLKAVGCRTCR